MIAACLLIDGEIIVAAQEERFTRKYDSSYPYNSVQYVLKFAKLKLSEVDQIVFMRNFFKI